MKIKNIMVASILTITAGHAIAQKVVRGHEFLELAKIADRYEHTENLNFKIHYTYSDSANPKQIVDSSTAWCLTSNGKSIMNSEGVTLIQNQQYAITIDKQDSIIFVGPPNNRSLLQLPFMDSIFMRAHITSIVSKDINDTLRKLTFFFNPLSNYHGYEISYRSDLQLIKQIKMYIKNDPRYDIDRNSVLCVVIDFDTYSTSPNNPAFFNEEHYVYQIGNKWFLQPDYKQYKLQIIN